MKKTEGFEDAFALSKNLLRFLCKSVHSCKVYHSLLFTTKSYINRICTAVVIFCVLSTYVHSLVKYLTRTDKLVVYK